MDAIERLWSKTDGSVEISQQEWQILLGALVLLAADARGTDRRVVLALEAFLLKNAGKITALRIKR